MQPRNWCVGVVLGLWLSAGVGGEISGKVVRVVDGDTLVLLDGSNQQVKVRLRNIDAPEHKQPFGNKAREALAQLCAGKQALLKETGKDRYQRTLALVMCDGEEANRAMVAAGFAWVYTQYNQDNTLPDVQREAKAAKRGLWVDPAPVPPWEWRQK